MSTIISCFNSLIDLQNSYCLKHKEIVKVVKDLEMKSVSLNLGQDCSYCNKKSIVDLNALDQLFVLGNSLVELDQKNQKVLDSIQDNLKPYNLIKKFMNQARNELLNTEKSIIKELSKFDSFFSEFSEKLHQLPKQENQFPTIHLQKKLETILSSLIHSDSLKSLQKNEVPKNPIHLLKPYYLDLTTEEPELELNCESENKKILHHMRFLLTSLEKLTESLLKLYKETTLSGLTLPELNNEEPNITTVTPSELKVLRLKINRLHNRGSLTDEEARSMLGKISVIPVSPDNESAGIRKKPLFENSYEIFDEDMPVTATHEKKKKKNKLFEKSFLNEISKKVRADKKERKSTPGKKIIRNSSLPKAMIAGKGKLAKEKSKQVKVKLKSPNSFL